MIVPGYWVLTSAISSGRTVLSISTISSCANSAHSSSSHVGSEAKLDRRNSPIDLTLGPVPGS